MLVFNRFIPAVGARSRLLAWPGHRLTRRRGPTRRIERIRALLPAVCGIGVAAIAGWLLTGGSLPSVQMLFGPMEPTVADGSVGGAPVHVESTPSGAAVRIDGKSRGKTPLDIHLERQVQQFSARRREERGAAATRSDLDALAGQLRGEIRDLARALRDVQSPLPRILAMTRDVLEAMTGIQTPQGQTSDALHRLEQTLSLRS